MHAFATRRRLHSLPGGHCDHLWFSGPEGTLDELRKSFAGLGWLTFLSPSLGAEYLHPYILIMASGEGFLTLWLLVMRVDAERWKEQAGAHGAPGAERSID